MPITISSNAKNVGALQHLKNGVHTKAIFGNDNKDHPLSCGLFTITHGEPVAWNYPCTEFVYGVEGVLHLQLEDAAGKPVGEPFILHAGDIARVDKGTKMSWSSPTGGKGFYVSQIGHEVDLKQYLA